MMMCVCACVFWWQAEGTSAESIAAIAKIDIVKQRMEAAYETLQVWAIWIVNFIMCRREIITCSTVY